MTNIIRKNTPSPNRINRLKKEKAMTQIVQGIHNAKWLNAVEITTKIHRRVLKRHAFDLLAMRFEK